MAINDVFSTLGTWVLGGGNTNNSGESDSGVSGGGLITTQWQVDNADNGRTLNYTSEDSQEYSSLVYSPTTMSYTIPIITISGSSVSDSANTSTSQPQTTTQTPTQQTTQTADQSGSGADSDSFDLTGLLVPLAVVGGIGVLGYTAIKVFAGGK